MTMNPSHSMSCIVAESVLENESTESGRSRKLIELCRGGRKISSIRRPSPSYNSKEYDKAAQQIASAIRQSCDPIVGIAISVEESLDR